MDNRDKYYNYLLAFAAGDYLERMTTEELKELYLHFSEGDKEYEQTDR